MRIKLFSVLVSFLALIPACAHDPCLIDGDGCSKHARLELSTCVMGGEALSLEGLLEHPPEPGSRVCVQGPLRRESATCTMLGCADPDGCCNGCAAALLLSYRDGPISFAPGDLRLSGKVDGVDLLCTGDESLVCCPVNTDGEPVIVVGTFREEGRSIKGSLYGLVVESMCWAH